MMKIFTVHVNPKKPRPFDEPEFVKEGFSLPAFIFMPFWAFYHRLWLTGALLLTAEILLTVLMVQSLLHPVAGALLRILLRAYVGLEGNEWVRRKLAKRGFLFADVVTGTSETAVKQRFYERHLTQAVG